MIRDKIKTLMLKGIIRLCKTSAAVESSVQRILVVRLDEIGDMVLISPFLRELRRNYPEAEITLVVKPVVYNLVELCPYVNYIKTFERPSSGRGMFFRILWAAKRFASNELIGEYDLAIVPRFDTDASYGAGLVAFFSKAKRRIGFESTVTPNKFISDRGYDCLYTEFVQVNPGIVHEVERDLDVIRYLGGDIKENDLELWLDEADRIKADSMLARSTSNDTLILIVLLSAGGRRKEWDVENFIEVVKRLQHLFSIQSVLLGAGEPADKYGRKFQDEIPDCLNLINKCTLRESFEIMKQSQLILGCDTGPMHIAAVAGMHGVALYLGKVEWTDDGLDTPERFGPWKSNITIMQPDKLLPGCEHGCIKPYAHCINQIRVEDVVKSMEKIIESSDKEYSGA